MPRKPTEKHPIRDLRKIIGKTQCGFAKTLGIYPGTLKRIENNSLNLTPKIAIRIQAETGINVEKLLDGKLRDELGRKYTAEFYKKWKEVHFRQSEKIAKQRAAALAWWIEILLRASVVGSKRRLWQVVATLVQTIDECCSDFDLRAPVENILATYKPVVKWNPAGRTPRELGRIFREQAREEIGLASVRKQKNTRRAEEVTAVAQLAQQDEKRMLKRYKNRTLRVRNERQSSVQSSRQRRRGA